jgi:hypothetical protein
MKTIGVILRGLVLLVASSIVTLGVSGCPTAGEASGGFISMRCEGTPKLAGSWKLVSFNIKDSNGQITYPFGQNAQGRLIYEPDGRMAVQLMDPSRPNFTSDDPLVTSEAELRAAFGGYTAYYGTYSVNSDDKTIVHHIEAALLPNWVGTDQRRDFEFDGNHLTLKGPLLLGGVQGVVSLVWERLP